MKTNVLTSLVVLISLGVGTLCAKDVSTQKTNRQPLTAGRIILKKRDIQTSTSKPKAPSLQRIECVYDGANVSFSLIYAEGECSILIEDVETLESCSYIVDTSDCTAEVYVGELYESTVTLTTESGVVYTAVLTSE